MLSILDYIKKYGTPFLLTDLNKIKNNYENLNSALSYDRGVYYTKGVDLYYALKPNSHPEIIKFLNEETFACFDIATSGELEILKKLKIKNLDIGIKNYRKIIHTHPIKSDRSIKQALNYGIDQFVVDNKDEILKFIKYKKRVKVLLRLAFSSPDASINLSKKFGCDPDQALNLMEFARSQGIYVNGLAFHVGSQCKSPDMYCHAIKKCNDIIAHSILKGFPEIEILDIGGGFPVDYSLYGEKPVNIFDFCRPIVNELKNLNPRIQVIAEPGRFIVADSTIGVSKVIGKNIKNNVINYYIDDGVYGSYSGKIFDGISPPITAPGKYFEPGIIKGNISNVYGPTCDSIDIVAENILLPNLEIGDYIHGYCLGAYAYETSTTFNKIPKVRQIITKGFF